MASRRVHLELVLDGDRVTGTLHAEDAPDRRIGGWLDLVTAIEAEQAALRCAAPDHDHERTPSP